MSNRPNPDVATIVGGVMTLRRKGCEYAYYLISDGPHEPWMLVHEGTGQRLPNRYADIESALFAASQLTRAVPQAARAPWYRRPGTKWHLGRCDGTYRAVCGANMVTAPWSREGMSEDAACAHCWAKYSAGFEAAS